METKVCTKCGAEKELDNFYVRSNRDGVVKRRNECKECASKQCKVRYQEHGDKIRERSKARYENNKEQISIYGKLYRKIHKKEIAEYLHQYYEDNKDELAQYQQEYNRENKEYINDRQKRYNKEHKEQLKARQTKYMRDRYQSDPVFRMKVVVSLMIRSSLKRVGASKNGQSCFDYLGYTPDDLKNHIEKQFKSIGNEWMRWENHGRYDCETWKDTDTSTWTWNLDHRIPQADLPYTSMKDENFQKCWSLENLRPYSSKQNIIDGATRVRHNKKTNQTDVQTSQTRDTDDKKDENE